MKQVYSSISEARVLPELIRIDDNLIAAKFFLMKLLPAKFILERALKNGDINEDTVVLESTSGTFGLALALLCNQYNLKLILVSDPAIDVHLNNRLTELGARVDIVTEPAEVGGYQAARLERLAHYRRQHPNHFFPAQYENKMNPGAYAFFAEQLISAFGKVDILVGSVGSGGSMCGTLKALRTMHPQTMGVAVDSNVSMLFGRPDGGAKRIIRGLGNSLMPQNLDHSVFDQVHWLNASEIACATRTLHKRHGLYCGPTSGAAFKVARYLADQNPDKKVVFICADEGYRYSDNIYSPTWWRENQLVEDDQLSLAPECITDPSMDAENWSYLPWHRRSLTEVMNPLSTVGIA
ncbi:pyridoxal-phosphate dependent enzyme [Reinekea sp. G2M2-21]|uniref:pyridoxal-phosphate dependent enzyme n=1 Tax=Reinekea sp. G2M2-21 TaxID=2788942 RepID=UPI0018AA7030|nr:pyridoxal-phosphate dependent enzyme [Reinekea sp. G2M2-21]